MANAFWVGMRPRVTPWVVRKPSALRSSIRLRMVVGERDSREILESVRALMASCLDM